MKTLLLIIGLCLVCGCGSYENKYETKEYKLVAIPDKSTKYLVLNNYNTFPSYAFYLSFPNGIAVLEGGNYEIVKVVEDKCCTAIRRFPKGYLSWAEHHEIGSTWEIHIPKEAILEKTSLK